MLKMFYVSFNSNVKKLKNQEEISRKSLERANGTCLGFPFKFACSKYYISQLSLLVNLS